MPGDEAVQPDHKPVHMPHFEMEGIDYCDECDDPWPCEYGP